MPAVDCVFANDCTAGRRPLSGLEPPTGTGTVAAWLARAAELEAGAVLAFRELAVDLKRHGAPARLVRSAQRAAREERRHARVMRALALRRGARPRRVVCGPPLPQSLVELAEHNAAEGCVRELAGAVVATWQGEHATDPGIRAALRRIARDETRHAALSLQIDGWCRSRLGFDARRRVARARQAARAQLLADAEHPVPVASVRTLGLPDRVANRRLVRSVVGWSG